MHMLGFYVHNIDRHMPDSITEQTSRKPFGYHIDSQSVALLLGVLKFAPEILLKWPVRHRVGAFLLPTVCLMYV